MAREDFLREECDALNPIFFHFITTNTPYVALKYAMTLDGKIATKTGESKWISNEASRKYVHRLRNQYSGILTGIGTLLKDDPMLNCRLTDENGIMNGRNPIRIICDSDLRIPLDCKIVKSAGEIKTLVASSLWDRPDKKRNLYAQKKKALEEAGIEVIEVCPSDAFADLLQDRERHSVDLCQLMKILGEKKIDSILIEGGSEIQYSALEAGIVKKVYAFLAPKIFGGQGKSPVGGEGVSQLSQAFKFRLEKIMEFEEDVLLIYTA